MKTSKLTEGQIAFVLKQTDDGKPVAEVCRKRVVPRRRSTIGASCAGLMPSEAAAPAQGRKCQA